MRDSVYSVSNVHLSIHAWRNSASHSLPYHPWGRRVFAHLCFLRRCVMGWRKKICHDDKIRKFLLRFDYLFEKITWVGIFHKDKKKLTLGLMVCRAAKVLKLPWFENDYRGYFLNRPHHISTYFKYLETLL